MRALCDFGKFLVRTEGFGGNEAWARHLSAPFARLSGAAD